MPSAITPLANYTFSGASSTMVFSSINQSYKDLILVVSVPSQVSGTISIAPNGDTANLTSVYMRGNGSTAVSSTQTTGALNTVSSTAAASIKIDLMDYSATDKHKSMLTRFDNSSAESLARITRWASTSAITSITISHSATNGFGIGTSFALYGVSA